MVDGAMPAENGAPTFELSFDYASEPLVIPCGSFVSVMCEVLGDEIAVVDALGVANLQGAVGFLDRFQVGLLVPVAIASGDSIPIRTDDAFNTDIRGGTGGGLGDLRLHVKGLIAGDSALAASAVVYGTAPTGRLTAEYRYIGEYGPTLGGHIVGEFRGGPVRVAANVGGIWRGDGTLLTTESGSDLTYGLGAALEAASVGVIAELTGATGFRDDDFRLESRLAGLLNVGEVALTVGGGVGLSRGVGVPAYRLLGGVRWTPETTPDTDGDGMLDDVDTCPTHAEDFDGHHDRDGCPDDDNDEDGLPDRMDECPNAAEDADGFNDADGCPEPDNDSDDLADGFDSCPMDPEDKDGDRDDDGCPDDDRDQDGISDAQDRCPEQEEDTDGLADDDGCPERDFDRDGIPDEDDVCPEVRGDMVDGVCPDPNALPVAPAPGTTPAAPPASPTPAPAPRP
jgi:hypothetical protein